ncbi:ankyrin repeat-containing domain protein, partial [Tuber borchii]
YAAQNRHEQVVKIRLALEVNPRKPDDGGRTLFPHATKHGREGVRAAKMLLELGDVDPNKSDNGGQTPLYCAAHDWNEREVKWLLRHDDINPDKPGSQGQTPLGYASSAYSGVVEILLR